MKSPPRQLGDATTVNTTAAGFRIYFFALRCGARLLFAGQLVAAIKTLVAPVGYWRFLPNAIALQEALRLRNPAILDVSSPKLLSIFLASKTSGRVTATDLDDEQIFSRWKMLAQTLGLDNYTAEYQDARQLTYPDNSFDLVYSISVIEHIPDQGDMQALQEFRRVLKPGGTLVIEVPYRRKGKDVFRNTDSKGAPAESEQFYERYYDAGTLAERLLSAPGLKLDRKAILSEWLPVDPWISGDQLPRPLRLAILPFEPLLAFANCSARPDDTVGRPLAALMIYRKEQGPAARMSVLGTP